jgi:hypothetical protein
MLPEENLGPEIPEVVCSERKAEITKPGIKKFNPFSNMVQQLQNVPNFHWEEKDAFSLDVVDKACPFVATSQKSELKYPLISNLIIIGKCLTIQS